MVKYPSVNAGEAGDTGSILVGKKPWSRQWQPTPVFLPGEVHGQRSPAGYSPWCLKELDMTEDKHTHRDCIVEPVLHF